MVYVCMQVKQEKETATVVELPLTLTVSVISSISQIPADHWDACALDSTGPESANPFITHAFLSSLEDSKSAVPEEGWLPQHLVARHGDGSILGVVPLYLKRSHLNSMFLYEQGRRKFVQS
jgi:predicted N-acyltransferase